MSTYCVLGIILVLERPSGSSHSNGGKGRIKYEKHISAIEMELSCGAQRKNVVMIIT